MLPRESRMRLGVEFGATVRRGKRSGRGLVTAHLLLRPEAAAEQPRAGFVVARTVGTAVVRNRVRRRLRTAVRALLPSLPGGSLLVVRAHPPSASARQAELSGELGVAVQTILRQAGARQ